MFFRRARALCPAPSRYVLKEYSGDATEQAEYFIEEWFQPKDGRSCEVAGRTQRLDFCWVGGSGGDRRRSNGRHCGLKGITPRDTAAERTVVRRAK